VVRGPHVKGRTATCLPLDVGQLPNQLAALREASKGEKARVEAAR
jgi:hypothetical protein